MTDRQETDEEDEGPADEQAVSQMRPLIGDGGAVSFRLACSARSALAKLIRLANELQPQFLFLQK
jgi:hypothetical protein